MRGVADLTFLSWNLALFERSAQAPVHWQSYNTEAAVRDRVLELAPDVICYQELPGQVPFVETHEMIKANPQSHSGHLATLVTNELAATEPRPIVVEGCALLVHFDALDLTIANVHLAPGRAAEPERLHQLATVVEASPTERLFVVGDTNTRLSEAEAIGDAGLGGTKPPHVTFDSRRNRFRTEMPEFSAYFTRWFAGPGVTANDVKVWREPHEVDGHSFFLSDHYAMSGTIITSPEAGS